MSCGVRMRVCALIVCGVAVLPHASSPTLEPPAQKKIGCLKAEMEPGEPSAPFQGPVVDISLIAALGLPNTSSKEDVLGAMQNLQRLVALGRQAEMSLRIPVVQSSTSANLDITS